MKQDVRTIYPVDMREHGSTSLGGHLRKTEMLLAALMKQFDGPAAPVPHDHLPCRGPPILAGKRLAATIRAVAPCGPHPRDLASVAQRARGVSDANVHALACVARRRQPHGVPRAPALPTEKRLHGAPRLRCGGGQSERFRLAATSPQSTAAVGADPVPWSAKNP